MSKTRKIIYWVATIWLSLGMTSSAIVQLMRQEESVSSVEGLGFPAYLLSILGIWKLLGVVAILIPRLPVIKEWAYAGFFFVASGAAISHVVMQDPITETLPSILLLVLTIASWYLRAEDRRLRAS